MISNENFHQHITQDTTTENYKEQYEVHKSSITLTLSSLRLTQIMAKDSGRTEQ